MSSDRSVLRLPDFDYRMPGPYFITMCLYTRVERFGSVLDGQVSLSEAGMMVEQTWFALPTRFPTLVLDSFVVMPDHIHAIVTLSQRGIDLDGPQLGDVIKAFKSETTIAYGRGVRDGRWPPYLHRFWQSNYYEHIIRDDRDLDIRRTYVEGNPGRWQESRRGTNP